MITKSNVVKSRCGSGSHTDINGKKWENMNTVLTLGSNSVPTWFH